MDTKILVGLVAGLVGWYYWKLKRGKQFWKVRGVPGPEPSLLMGNTPQVMAKNRGEIDLEWSLEYGKIYGYFLNSQPLLMVTDNELIKQILVKDFPHFHNRHKLLVYHEMWNENMLLAEDDYWKRLRTISTPAFTSGKLRSMSPVMNRCVDQLINCLDRVIAKKSGIIKDTKSVMAGFTIDTIAATSFATEINANDNQGGAKNPIVVNGKQFFEVNRFRAMACFMLPGWLSKLIGLKTFFDPPAFQYLIDLTREIVRQRKQSPQKRNDLVQLLLDSYVSESDLKATNYDKLTVSIDKEDQNEHSTKPESSEKKFLTESEIIAQCILFFVGGFETTASTIFHAVYELAKNPSIQDRLFQELTKSIKDLDHKSEEYLDLVLNHIPFLEATIKETLRMYPPIAVLFRRVSSDNFKLAGIPLPKDTLVEISPYAVHHNPDYYPEPERFNPDRFMPENKDQLKPYTYLPFGGGPRNCMGMRFAYQEVKLCLAELITRYRFERTEGTPDRPEFIKGLPLLVTQTFPLKISSRVL